MSSYYNISKEVLMTGSPPCMSLTISQNLPQVCYFGVIL
jgi:hypothetical protein